MLPRFKSSRPDLDQKPLPCNNSRRVVLCLEPVIYAGFKTGLSSSNSWRSRQQSKAIRRKSLSQAMLSSSNPVASFTATNSGDPRQVARQLVHGDPTVSNDLTPAQNAAERALDNQDEGGSASYLRPFRPLPESLRGLPPADGPACSFSSKYTASVLGFLARSRA